MLNIKTLLVLLIIAASSMYFALKHWKTADDTSVSNEVLMPQLASKLGDIDAIEVQRGESKVNLERNEDSSGWSLASRDGYPASGSAVGSFLRGLSELRTLEEKTSDPDRYPQLSLGDPAQEESGATLYRVKAKDAVVAELITGKERSASSNADRQELYVRFPDKPQSWLVEGHFSGAKASVDWLDQTIVSIESADITRIQVDHPDDESVIVTASASSPGQFELNDIPDGFKLKLEFALNDLANAFSDLDLVDVFAQADTDYSDGITASVDTKDGLRVRMQTGTLNDEPVARFVAMEGPLPASADDSTVNNEDQKDEDSNEKEGSDADNTSESESQDTAAVIEDLNKRWSGWVYKVRSFKLQNITRKKSELIEENAPPESTDAQTDSATDSAMPNDSIHGGVELTPTPPAQ